MTPGQVPKTKRRTLAVTKDWGGLGVGEAVEPITLVQRTTGARTANKKEGRLCRVPPGSRKGACLQGRVSNTRMEMRIQHRGGKFRSKAVSVGMVAFTGSIFYRQVNR